MDSKAIVSTLSTVGREGDEPPAARAPNGAVSFLGCLGHASDFCGSKKGLGLRETGEGSLDTAMHGIHHVVCEDPETRLLATWVWYASIP